LKAIVSRKPKYEIRSEIPQIERSPIKMEQLHEFQADREQEGKSCNLDLVLLDVYIEIPGEDRYAK